MSTAAFKPEQILEQLDQARNLAFSNAETYPQVLKHVLKFIPNQEKLIENWCIEFLRDSFVNQDKLKHSVKVDLAIDSLPVLVTLSNTTDMKSFKHVINIASVIYRLVFKYAADNDGCNAIWSQLTELKNSLVNKFQSNFPLGTSNNEEHDLLRNIDTKLELTKFIMIVIDYQSKTTVINSNNGTPPLNTFSLSNVSTNHTLIKYSNMEYEAVNLLDLLLKTLNSDIIIPPLVSAILNHLIIIMKRKPQYVNKVLSIVDTYDTNTKLQSNFQTIEQFKLAKKYTDRVFKIFIQHSLRNNLVPTNYQNPLNKKLTLLIDRGNDIRKKNIFAIVEPNIKKRKFDGFLNPSKKMKTMDYKNLYCLNEVDNELNNFDLSSVPQNILIQMVLTALQRASVSKLSKALEIISERYINVIESAPPGSLGALNPVQQNTNDYNQPKNNVDYDEEDDDRVGQDFNAETVYTLPPPKELSFHEKKDNISIIIKNFFKLANNPSGVNVEENVKADESNTVNSELTKIAIHSWKKDSWLVLLTRLATRGMRSRSDVELTPDAQNNDGMSDLIRTAIFDYFLDNIHGRIDMIIEWLNEEWYSERVYNEEILIKQQKENKIDPESTTTDPESTTTDPESTTKDIIETPIYNKWAGKVLDAMIPFLEPNDRKIFIRLLSDLPYLNEDLVSRIKSLCFDPVRTKIGFLSLQFLIMFRPPVKQVCLNILQELTESDQEDLKEEAKKLLAKYTS